MRVILGRACAECDKTQGLVITDNFECEECSSRAVTVLLFVGTAIMAPVCLVLYAKSNEDTRAPSMLSVWFKIIVSAFAANAIAARVFH